MVVVFNMKYDDSGAGEVSFRSKPSEFNSLPNNDSHPQARLLTFSQNLKHYIYEYSQLTKIHGIQFIGERGRYLIETIFWICVIIIVWTATIFCISKTYHQCKIWPFIVIFSTAETPVSHIPFPAVTVCPRVKCSASQFNVTEVSMRKHNEGRLSKQEQSMLLSLFLVCDGPIMRSIDTDYSIIDTSGHLVDSLWKLSKPVFRSSKWLLTWLGHNIKMDERNLTLTELGFCYTFNSLHTLDIFKNKKKPRYLTSDSRGANGWSLHSGYSDPATLNFYPKRSFVSGLKGGVKFDLETDDADIEYVCGTAVQGYQVAVHHPAQLPIMNDFIQLPLDAAVNIAILPKMIKVSTDLKSYLPSERKCYYSHERSLKHFKWYTQSNCVFECVANYTVKNCGCAAFYMPRSVDTPVCTFMEYYCVKESTTNYVINTADVPSCGCLPSCTSVSYDIEISKSSWNWRPVKTLLKNALNASRPGLETDFDRVHYSRLTVYFKQSQFLSTERAELHGLLTVLSRIGGILGLFVGFTSVTFIEMIYFLTLRMACNIKKYGKEFWAGKSIVKAIGNR